MKRGKTTLVARRVKPRRGMVTLALRSWRADMPPAVAAGQSTPEAHLRPDKVPHRRRRVDRPSPCATTAGRCMQSATAERQPGSGYRGAAVSEGSEGSAASPRQPNVAHWVCWLLTPKGQEPAVSVCRFPGPESRFAELVPGRSLPPLRRVWFFVSCGSRGSFTARCTTRPDRGDRGVGASVPSRVGGGGRSEVAAFRCSSSSSRGSSFRFTRSSFVHGCVCGP